MHSVEYYFSLIPLIVIGSVCFYVSLIGLIVRPFRNKFINLFKLVTPSTSSYVSSFNGLRGFSALLVACFHTWQWLQPFHNNVIIYLPFIASGNKAVPIFASLSGFLIYSSLVSKPITTNSLRMYFNHRFIRIYPLYYVTVIVFTISGQMRSDPTVVHGLMSELLMFQVFGFPYLVNLPSWSIYVEVFFYLILPFYLLIFNRLIIKSSIMITILSLIVGHSATQEFQLIPFFMIGIIACEITRNKNCRYSLFIKRNARTIFLSGIILLSIDLMDYNPVLRLLEFLLNPIGLIGLVQHIITDRGVDLLFGLFLTLIGGYYLKYRDHFAFYPLNFLGVISYSLYLWHGFIITFDLPISVDGFSKLIHTGKLPETSESVIYFLLYIPCLIFFSGLSYLIIERPFLMLKAKYKSKE